MNNPYEVLGIRQNATQREIIAAMGPAMRARKYQIQEIQAAQVQLRTPAKRLAADFTFPLLGDTEKVELIKIADIDERINVESFNENKYNTL